MTKDYRPREGTLIVKVITKLQAEGGALDSNTIAAAFGAEPTSVAAQLKPAVLGGLLARQRQAYKTRGYEWSLTDKGKAFDVQTLTQGEVDNKPLDICIWGDGDVIVSGHRTTENDEAIFSPAQIRQLVLRLATPTVSLPGV